ncbi:MULTISPECIES: tetratricopeptide repeat protein [unclassified Streptomyces]|uniref:tetratricopeptide repeat protein n=1 Tax=unclassified Streptomyces TaxID=2593676 RepID=UPI0023656B03|nr:MULTISPECIES: tetratricopeptide repeat protein [unclassified Streptomyces]MDF3143853.1 tetratricopeptide repeat protein [Streptomyces sp. T21Q-yed]WDF40479.1 tetratricopeptide repeat protein [Streptomyces sp. T12]
MSLLSRAKKREQKRAAASAAPVVAPIDVRVPAVGSGADGASIGGVPVTAAPGEEIQHVVLTHLQRIALAAGHAVHATVHDERIGYVVPLRVDADGSSHFTAEPVRMPPAGGVGVPGEPTVAGDAVRLPAGPPVPSTPPVSPAPSTPPAPGAAPHRDKPTRVLRPLPSAVQDASPTFRLRTLPEPVQDAVPGTVAPPLGEFGPPPQMDARPMSADGPHTDLPSAAVPQADLPIPGVPIPGVPIPGVPIPGVPKVDQASARVVREPGPVPEPLLISDPGPDPDPDPKPTPPRGFDAVAEAVLGDGAPATTTTDASPFAEPLARLNEAVTAGRTAEAAELAERTVAQASAVLGAAHPEVLRIRELAAYVAYLAGDLVHAFGLSLDVARTHHHTHDAEAAYSSLQGAATAWRAVRDPAQGLDLGRDLLGLWTELTAEGGPAAEDIEELEAAHARMGRLAARAAKSAEPPRS